jgi:hypothetical protein
MALKQSLRSAESYTVSRVARLLSLRKEVVRQQLARGALKGQRIDKKEWRVSADEIIRFASDVSRRKKAAVFLVVGPRLASKSRIGKAGIDSTIKEEGMPNHTIIDEHLGAIVTGLEEFKKEHLLRVAPQIFAASERVMPAELKSLPERELRSRLVDAARTVYGKAPERLLDLRKQLREVALEILTR